MAKAMDAGSEKTRKSIRLSDLEYGDTIIVKPLDKIEASLPFSYPAYKPDYKDEGKYLDGFAQFNMTLDGIPSQAEQAMLTLFSKALDNLKREVAKRKRQYKLDYIESTKPDGRWGKRFEQFGLTVVSAGNICDLQMSNGQKNAFKAARDKVVGNKLEYTPLLCNLQINLVEGEAFGKKIKSIEASVLEPQAGCKGLLPASFVRCLWCHPDDFQKMQAWVEAYHKAVFNFSTKPQAPAFRDYPDENGKLYYIATESVQDPYHVNVFDYGVSSDLVKAIASRQTGYLYKSATQHSLLGGYFYQQIDGSRRPVSMEEIKANFIRAEDGKAVVNLDGEERQLDWIAGSLYQKKFNPLLENAAGKLVFDDCKPEELVELARSLGIPVKGDQDPQQIVDWESFLAQKAAVPSKSAPVANM